MVSFVYIGTIRHVTWNVRRRGFLEDVMFSPPRTDIDSVTSDISSRRYRFPRRFFCTTRAMK